MSGGQEHGSSDLEKVNISPKHLVAQVTNKVEGMGEARIRQERP